MTSGTTIDHPASPLRLLVQQPGDDGFEPLVFRRTPIFVGRNTKNDLVLESEFVSDQHGMIEFDGTSATYTDLASLNGSFTADGERLPADNPVSLREIDEIVLGATRIRVAPTLVSSSSILGSAPTTFLDPTVLGVTPDLSETLHWQRSENSPSTQSNGEGGRTVSNRSNSTQRTNNINATDQLKTRTNTRRLSERIRKIAAHVPTEILAAAACVLIAQAVVTKACSEPATPLVIRERGFAETDERRPDAKQARPRHNKAANKEVTPSAEDTASNEDQKKLEEPEKPVPRPTGRSHHDSRDRAQEVARGKKLFRKMCNGCHGDNGKGDTHVGRKLAVPSIASTRISRTGVAKVIKNGVPGTKMRAYKDRLSTGDIAAIAAFVKNL